MEGANFAVLVEKAKITEDVKCAERQNREKDKGRNKRVWEPSGTTMGPKKKARFDGPAKVGVPVSTIGLQPCANYGKRHQGECWKRLGACLRCGSIEHRIRDCPRSPDQMKALGMGTVQPQRGFQQPPRGQARGRNGMGRGCEASGRGAGHNEERQSALVYAASCTVSETVGVMFENTMSKVTVLSLLGQPVRVNKLFKEVPLEIQGRIFLADLIELPFREFDLILGMDWLDKHQANLDCAAKQLVLKTAEGDGIVVIGEHRNYLSNVISKFRAEKLVRKGYEAYLAYFSASGSEASAVKDIRKVRDFLDVFPDELPGLPPNCEVEFGIELLSSTALVSIAPYRMGIIDGLLSCFR
ncbi:uncharacterized protein LOC128292694 [Gossypium arboreum]|uniref:uncharacterized protein LOC128292694 n=1 Tax=Gossypium arboreum TaxID=29729 RepID=UPI0022F1D71E|nr:uncharacterized protein LOC128292694 [Gossypium arboreum]